jgi:cytochrome c oxidase subunit 2
VTTAAVLRRRRELVGASVARSKSAVRRLLGAGVTGVAALTLLAGCGEVGDAFSGFGWPEGGITPQAERMYDLWVGSVIAALLVGFLVWGLIFWCVVRYRKRGDDLPMQTRYNMPMEVLYSVTPVLVILVLFYYTWVVQTEVDEIPRTDPDISVEVVAFKWNWQFNYRDGVGPEADTVASTTGSSDYIPVLVLPTGRTVRFELTGRDVIHSFWVPEMLFKRDVFPGIARGQFQTTIAEDAEGAYVGRCAELCGTYHSMMNFEVRAVSPEQYERFLAALTGGMSTPDALASIGEAPFAVTTAPFDTRRES